MIHRTARWSLTGAGASSASIAVLHVVIALVGPTPDIHFGAADVLRKPPLLMLGVWLIGVIYTLRGLMLFAGLLLMGEGGATPPRFAVFSFVSPATGIAYLFGAWKLRGKVRLTVCRLTLLAADERQRSEWRARGVRSIPGQRRERPAGSRAGVRSRSVR